MRLSKISFCFSVLLLFTAFNISSCKKGCPSSISKDFNVSGFHTVQAGDAFTVNIHEGTAYSVSANGCSTDMEDLVIANNNGFLKISYSSYSKNRSMMQIDIILPVLSGIIFSDAVVGNVTASNSTATVGIQLSGFSHVVYNGNIHGVYSEISMKSHLELNGSTGSLVATVSGQSSLDAYGCITPGADLRTRDQATAHVHVTNYLGANASDQSTIFYRGTPGQTQLTTSGSARIIPE